MDKFPITEACKIVRHSNAVAAGTTDIEPSTGIDTAGFMSVTFLVLFGAIEATAVTSVKAQQSTASDGTGDAFADVAGTSISVAATDDNKIVALEIMNPTERYVRCVVDRGTANATVDGIVAILSGASNHPTTHDSTTVVGYELHNAPAEGTA